MVNKNYIPNRGDLVWVDFNPVRGHEQSKVRPALVLSPKVYNKKTNLFIVCAITSKVKDYPFEVSIDEKKVEGVVLVDQVRTLDWTQRKVKFIQKAPVQTVIKVAEKLTLLIS